jgi:hypothetical protein
MGALDEPENTEAGEGRIGKIHGCLTLLFYINEKVSSPAVRPPVIITKMRKPSSLPDAGLALNPITTLSAAHINRIRIVFSNDIRIRGNASL